LNVDPFRRAGLFAKLTTEEIIYLSENPIQKSEAKVRKKSERQRIIQNAAESLYPGTRITRRAENLAQDYLRYLATSWLRDRDSGPAEEPDFKRRTMFNIALLSNGRALKKNSIYQILRSAAGSSENSSTS